MRKKTSRRSNGGVEPIDRIIQRVFATGKLANGAHVAELWGQWKELVGADVAQHCVPEKIAGGKLYVRVDSPVWHQQLDLLKEELIEKIAAMLPPPGISKIVFRSSIGDDAGRKRKEKLG